MHLDFTIQTSPLGRLMIVVSEIGICNVAIADDEATLLRFLHQAHPKVFFKELNDMEAARQIQAFLRGECRHFDLSLDIQVTVFQQRVLDILAGIPFGETRSYTQVTESLGDPKAIRAVAQACGANPVPIIVPCHRVIASDGTLGGFSMGLGRKQALLDLEQSFSRG